MADSENTFSDDSSAVPAVPVPDAPSNPLSEDLLKYKTSGLPRVFASGDKRLLQSINNGNNTIHPIHSQYEEMNGLNFLGNLTNIKQHIQFIKYINNECDIPKNILHLFLKGYEVDKYYQEMGITEFDSPTKEALLNLSFFFDKCETYIFQITSLDIAEKDGYQVRNNTKEDGVNCYKQTIDDFKNDITILISLIPNGRKIIFVNDIYPELVLNDDSLKNQDLEIITQHLGSATQNSEYTEHSVRFFNYNKLQVVPFFTELFKENSTEFKPMGLGFSFIMLHDYFIQP
jgi:hypothetical protein